MATVTTQAVFQLAIQMQKKLFHDFIDCVTRKDIPAFKQNLQLYLYIAKGRTLDSIIKPVLKKAVKEGFLAGVQLIVPALLPVDTNLEIDSKEKSSALLIATYAGNLGVVSYLVNQNADPNQKDTTGKTPLFYAVQNSEALETRKWFNAIAELLLKNGADPNYYEDPHMPFPLQLASKFNNLELCQSLVKHKADINAVNQVGETSLHAAAGLGYAKIVEFLLQQEGIIVDLETSALDVAIEYGIEKKNLESIIHSIVIPLLNKGAKLKGLTKEIVPHWLTLLRHLFESKIFEINTPLDIDHNTCLHWAAVFNDVELTQLLLNSPKKIELDARNNFGATALHYAVFLGNIAIVRLLLEHKANPNNINTKGMTVLQSALYVKCREEEPDELFTIIKGSHFYKEDHDSEVNVVAMVQTLLKAKADPNRVGLDKTPLMDAIQLGMNACVDILFPVSDLKLLSKNGYTLIQIAVLFKDAVTLNKILEQDKSLIDDYDSTIHDNSSPLSIASMMGDLVSVECLLNAGANLNLKQKFPPLLLAVEQNQTEVVKKLLEPKYKAEVDIVDEHGNRALTIAIKNGHIEIFSLLMVAGACPNQPNNKGITPLMWCVVYNRTEMLKTIIQAKADLNFEFTHGSIKYNAFSLAAKTNKKDYLLILLEAGFPVNALSSQGFTACNLAAKFGEFETLRFLIEQANADPSILCNKDYISHSEGRVTSLSMTSDVNKIRYLQSIGLEGDLISLKINFVCALLSNDAEIKEQLELINVCDKIFLFEYTLSCPLYIFANVTRDKNIFGAILKNKLINTYKTLHKQAIESFVNKLIDCCSELSFSEVGALCLSIKRGDDTYHLTLSPESEERLIKNHHLGKIEEMIFEYSDEGIAIKTERELRESKLDLIQMLNKAVQELEFFQEKLKFFQKVFDMGQLKIESKVLEELHSICNAHSKELDQISLGLRDENTIIAALNEMKTQINQIITSLREKLTHPIKSIDTQIQQLLRSHQTYSLKGLSKKAKQKKKETEKKLEEEFNNSCSMIFEDLSTPFAPKPAKILTSDKRNHLKSLYHHVRKQPTQVVPRQTTAVPPNLNSNSLSYKTIAETNKENVSVRKHLSIPAYSLASHTQIVERLKAKEATITLKSIISTLNPTASGIDGLINYRASLGSLAQMLETRKDFSENWPNNIRNRIYHAEEAINELVKKIGGESAVISHIQEICQKLEDIPEHEESRNLGRIELDKVDSHSFLKLLNEIPKPTMALKLAENLIQKASHELELLGNYINKNQKEAMESMRLKMAIGFNLSRIATSLNDIRIHNGNHPLLKSRYAQYILAGNAYRHNDPLWKRKVDAFIIACGKLNQKNFTPYRDAREVITPSAGPGPGPGIQTTIVSKAH